MGMGNGMGMDNGMGRITPGDATPGDGKHRFRRFRDVPAAFLALLLITCLVAVYATRGGRATSPAAVRPGPQSQGSPINQRLLTDAQATDALADTAEEQGLSREALRLSDHELDQAFASALREATAVRPPPSGPLKQLADRVASWNDRIAADEKRVADLSKGAASQSGAGPLELVKAQLALDQDELEDAQQDLARQGGDQHAMLERALQTHEASQKNATPHTPVVLRSGTLSEQFRSWLTLRDRERQLEGNRDRARSHVATLEKEHAALEQLATGKPASSAASSGASNAAVGSAAPGGDADISSRGPSDSDSEEDPTALLTRLRSLSDQRKALADLDKRIQDSQQLADVYAQWLALAAVRSTAVLHLLLRSCAVVVAILLAMLLIDRSIRRAFGRQADARRLYQLRIVSTIALQLVSAVLIVAIVFGTPNQTSTILGLATAGLTLVMKDFIVSFLGWFALMGKNGIRIGDWVEIRGVGGEVIQVGLLKTVILEMEEGGSSGHPTGRRVSFLNSFAIEGHYFNFSTAGQWLWDELQVALPATGDPYRLAKEIRRIVEQSTEADAKEAEKEWERVTHEYGTKPFSAKPVVDLRPSGSGLDVIARYITHAPQRHEVKSRLFEAIVDLLHSGGGEPEPAPQTSASL